MRFSTPALAILYLLFGLTPALADGHRVNFSISFQNLESDLAVLTTSVLPGATLAITTPADASSAQGSLSREGGRWLWTAPRQPGLAEIVFNRGQDSMLLNVFVLTPWINGATDNLNGYRIGRYSSSLFRGLESYAAPGGFIDLNHAQGELQVSPHFRLSQFICKQQPGHDPSYILLQPSMLIKLEALLEAANTGGWRADSFFVMSGFRTPYYNNLIGNDTNTSRHLYGGAADIWIDGDGDGLMDDLNGDGRIDKNDARELANLAESLARKGGRNWPPGGIGIYSANSAHGPFVHIDARGYRARWE